MNYVIFQNEGLVDLRAVTAFGVSSKENDNAIGYFGTGLKYAIAILLRSGCDVTLFIGEDRYDFGLERTTIRVDEFDFVTMTHGGKTETLAFTTKMGQEWELWMAYRELWSNTQDEKGNIWLSETDPVGEPGNTTVAIRGSTFVQQHMAQHEVVLQNNPDIVGDGAAAHAGDGAAIYYRGIRVRELKEKKALHNYNITNRVDLTEDRTLKYDFQAMWAIRAMILRSDDEAFIERCLTCNKGHLEWDIDYNDAGITPSATWLNVVDRLRNDHTLSLSRSADLLYTETVKPKGLNVREYVLDAAEKKQYDRAVSFLDELDFPVTDYPIVFTEYLGDGVLAQAKDGHIIVARRCFSMGTKTVAHALLEEFIHLRYKLYDETRDLQSFLFEQVLTLGERITGEQF